MTAALLAWALAATAAALTLERRARVRAELVACACHELRTPLTAVALALHLARRRGADAGPLVAAERELDRARLALDDLAAARDGRHAPDRPAPLDAGDLVAEAHAAWLHAARAARADLRLARSGGPLPVHGDRLRLAQALGILVANALEHGAGPVVLRARSAGAMVRLEVEDAGVGLPAAVGELAARPRAGRGRRGRGLSIAAAIAARHGGRLSAAPSARGARLVLELPAVASMRPVGPAGGGRTARATAGAPA